MKSEPPSNRSPSQSSLSQSLVNSVGVDASGPALNAMSLPGPFMTRLTDAQTIAVAASLPFAEIARIPPGWRSTKSWLCAKLGQLCEVVGAGSLLSQPSNLSETA